mgnify:CR=1 FL=1
MLKRIRRRLNARLAGSLLRSIGVDAAILRQQQQDYLTRHGQALAPSDRFHLVQRMGFTLLLDRACIIDRVVDIDGVWEEPQIRRLLDLTLEAGRHASGPRVFLDIGAYWGIYTLHAARSGLFNRVLAFEPDRVNMAQLQAQLLVNRLLRAVELYPLALSDVAGQAPLEHSEHHPQDNRGGIHLGVASAASDRVETRPLDAMLDLADGLVVAKIDVEGHELGVVRGARGTLGRNLAVLQIECFTESGNRDALAALLADLGYRHLETIGPDMYFTNVDGLLGASGEAPRRSESP